nr:MAG TPA: hypothetical protein [Caudoviricetes sp.]
MNNYSMKLEIDKVKSILQHKYSIFQPYRNIFFHYIKTTKKQRKLATI